MSNTPDDDIVYRLNNVCDETAICCEAAGEIEALREQVEDLKQTIDEYRK